MELKTVSEVSRGFGISTRTLRYYEELGLIESIRREGYAYRMYTEQSVRRLNQIIILRKLRIPLKQIHDILKNGDAVTAIEAFSDQVEELSDEITALSTIRTILEQLIDELSRKAQMNIRFELTTDETLLKAINALSLTRIQFKEEKSMEELNSAHKSLTKLKDVRIVYLPPCTVAAAHYIGENPEDTAGKMIDDFVQEQKLYEIKPDARLFGFNHPSPTQENQIYGYEFWITIPDNMAVPAPLEKKRFEGGLYAAHMIVMPNFHEWQWLADWVVNDNPKYAPNDICDGGEHMGGLLEEHLGYLYYARPGNAEYNGHQFDLLFPIRLKEDSGENHT
ncbi:effector binding domain-containing protein [Brucepastera parasyntrophica]|uniref:MerR family transcriptional regulator n=1 Tax=Brucepastera parasyntrophica TaxID=2880008 RepID=UPI00210AB1C5|nr:effector binding domain-containing protein [Brucepastera parasyntrophica]ULQ58773.1 effector binding domain-containing protein [Brucepastera parasyntrophica]